MASEKATDLCHQMLAHTGSTLISMEPINLSEEVSQLNSLFKSSLSMELEYKQELPTDLPMIDADINEIRQIILNLLINASDYKAQLFLKHNPKFNLLFQPLYHPWVNKIELVWKKLHDTVTRNNGFSTIGQLMEAVYRFMNKVSFLH